MLKESKPQDSNKNLIYNKILLLSRNKLFYTDFGLSDTFQNRIHLIFIHISFIFIKIKHDSDKSKYKDFYQKVFDTIFKNIELNMRELGYGDVSVNKSMKYLVKSFYNILIECETFNKKNDKYKKALFLKLLEINNDLKHPNNDLLINYFNQFQAFCFDLSSDSVLKGEINFNFK
tara:strand:- start:13688 stop:14212 length:525 start_codon:yes stop_codon:yes gene_type:complete